MKLSESFRPRSSRGQPAKKFNNGYLKMKIPDVLDTQDNGGQKVGY